LSPESALADLVEAKIERMLAEGGCVETSWVGIAGGDVTRAGRPLVFRS
jgi:hypothetical protein